MDSTHVRYDRTAQTGRPYFGKLNCSHRTQQYSAESEHLEYLLRHSPLRRSGDFSPCRPNGHFSRPVEREGNDSGFSGTSWLTWSYAYFRNTFSLATRADEPFGEFD